MSQQMEPLTETQIATLAGQTLAYGFLSKAFYTPPTTEFLNTLASQNLFAEWPLPAGRAETAQGVQFLRTFCAAWDKLQLGVLTEDYYRLFVGPDRLLAPPWESVYRSPDHLLFDAATIAVREAYQAFGLQAPNLSSEPDDHIGLELAFMVHLSRLALTAIEEKNECLLEQTLQAQRKFLREHLLEWVPRFVEDVKRHASTDYYRGVACLLLGTLAETVTLLDIPMKATA